MSLYGYFKKEASLPSPGRPLSKCILLSLIKSANKSVSTLLIQESPTVRKKIHGEYDAFTPEEKTRIVRCASKIGVSRAIRKLTKVFPDHSLKKSYVRTWMIKYKEEMKRNSVTGVHAIPTKLENRKRGHPLHLGNELDEQIKIAITALCIKLS